MGEDDSTFEALGKASEEKLFHLQNGLDIASIRELAIHLSKMSKTVFDHHVGEHHNDFATWVKDIFGDDDLAKAIEKKTNPKDMSETIEKHLLTLEEDELEKFGVAIPGPQLKQMEDYIEQKRKHGKNYEDIKKNLQEKGWQEQTLDLIIESGKLPHQNIKDIENLELFHQQLEELKKYIVNAVAGGVTIESIKESLLRRGWHQDIIDFIFFDIFKPHPNIRKLSAYIKYKVKDCQENVEKVRETLLALGWKSYIVDSLIYGVKDPFNDLDQILSYLTKFSPDNFPKIRNFLLEMGWSEEAIDDALTRYEDQKTHSHIAKNYNMEGTTFKKHSTNITKSLILLTKEDTQTKWDEQLKTARKMELKDFIKTGDEIHLEQDYTTYYAEEDFEMLESREKKVVSTLYYINEKKPLLIDLNEHYLILPRFITRTCIVCGKPYPITKLVEIIMWDPQRRHKIKRYACHEHEKDVHNLIEQTKIVQS